MFNFNEPYYEEEFRNHPAEELQQKLDESSEYFKRICDMLYGKKAYNQEHFQHCVEELAHRLQVKVPKDKIIIGE